jgi:hypothetical protein
MIETEKHPPRQKMKNSYEKFPRWLELIETHVELEILLGISPWEILNSVMKDLRRFMNSSKKHRHPPGGRQRGVQLQSPHTTQTKTKMKKLWRTYVRQTRD